MGRNRLEAFSDGVLAIVITIMVLELKVPHGADWSALSELWPIFLSYVLSFVYLGIYWNNHHHLIHTVQKVDGTILWANLHLLFWLSLVPFSTGWMGENHFAELPVGIYGFNLLAAGFAYLILERVIVASHGPQSTLARAWTRGTGWTRSNTPARSSRPRSVKMSIASSGFRARTLAADRQARST